MDVSKDMGSWAEENFSEFLKFASNGLKCLNESTGREINPVVTEKKEIEQREKTIQISFFDYLDNLCSKLRAKKSV